MFDIDDLESTLKFGKFQNKKSQLILKVIIILLLIIISLFIILFLFTYKYANFNSKQIQLLIYGLLFYLIIVISLIYFWHKGKKRILEISNWLQDAVECTAWVERLDLKNQKYQLYQIEVTFEFKNQKLTKVSNKMNFVIDSPPKIFAKYNKKFVKILYSAKYDQVLFLKH